MPRSNHQFIPLNHPHVTAEEVERRAEQFNDELQSRRSVRQFSNEPVSRATIEALIRAAGSAPSGAHKQPWTFVAISDPLTKAKIRKAAEIEEKESYENRMPEEWLEALEPFATDWHKPYLETAPWIIVLFQQTVEQLADGSTRKNYYVTESVGIAAGLLITAVHKAGLVTLTHTPSPMKFLSDILERPSNERPFLLLPIGYPAEGCEVPDIQRKSLGEIAQFIEGDRG